MIDRPTAPDATAPARRSRFTGALLRAGCIAAIVAGTFGLTTGTASAMPRNPCADLAHQAQVHLDIARGFNAMGQTFLNLGYYDLAIDQFDQGAYFTDAANVYLGDAAAIGC